MVNREVVKKQGAQKLMNINLVDVLQGSYQQDKSL
jgi:hypothetical protein